MALVYSGMPCALCQQPIVDPDVDCFTTTMNAELSEHPDFGGLSDTAVHQQCIDSWARRDDFVEFMNATAGEADLIVDGQGRVRYRVSLAARVWRSFAGLARFRTAR